MSILKNKAKEHCLILNINLKNLPIKEKLFEDIFDLNDGSPYKLIFLSYSDEFGLILIQY